MRENLGFSISKNVPEQKIRNQISQVFELDDMFGFCQDMSTC